MGHRNYHICQQKRGGKRDNHEHGTLVFFVQSRSHGFDTWYIEKQMQQLAASFEDVSKKTSEMFAGVNGSDVAKLIGAIDKGGVDEQKLVQAFLEQREDYKE